MPGTEVEIIPGISLQEFVKEFRNARISLRRLAEAAKFINDDNDLALAAHNYLRTEATLLTQLAKHSILSYRPVSSMHPGFINIGKRL